MTVVFLDGKPGAGKNYVATNVFRDILGYRFYDADDDLPEIEITAIKHGEVPSRTMRINHISRILDKTKELSKKHRKVVITHAFIRNQYREIILKVMPDAKFLLIECDPMIRNRRLDSRKNHIITSDFAKELDSEFEYPSISCGIIYNDNDGVEELLMQVSFLEWQRSG